MSTDSNGARSRLAYRLFNIAGRLLPADERARLLRVLATGRADECVPVEQAVLDAPDGGEHDCTGSFELWTAAASSPVGYLCVCGRQIPGGPQSGEIVGSVARFTTPGNGESPGNPGPSVRREGIEPPTR